MSKVGGIKGGRKDKKLRRAATAQGQGEGEGGGEGEGRGGKSRKKLRTG